jgi:dTDP-4-amino-4,6-dideoxygalactose transaminase
MAAELRSRRVPFQRPQLPPDREISAHLRRARQAHWFSNTGPCAALLAQRLGDRLGGANVSLVASGTAGLMVAIRAVAGEPGGNRDEALLPSFTFAAPAAAAIWAGFRPVFADIEPAGWHLDPARLRAALRKRRGRIRVVVAGCSFGVPPRRAQVQEWAAACREAEVPLVVDSAAGFGAADEAGAPLGSQGDVEVFSFHATKPFAIGEGGAVSCRSKKLAERVERLSNFGLSPMRRVTGPVGLNAKMSEIAAATGLAVLDGFDRVLKSRRRRAGELMRRLAPLGFEFQDSGGEPAWQFVPALAPTQAARARALAARGVELRRYYEPLHQMAPFKRWPRADRLEVTEAIAARALSLPMANGLSKREIDAICAALRRSTSPRSS